MIAIFQENLIQIHLVPDSSSDTAVMLSPEIEQFLSDISQSDSNSGSDDLEERGK